MKTILFFALIAPLSAFASTSFTCSGESGTLTISGPDASPIVGTWGAVNYHGTVVKKSGSIFQSIDYALVSEAGELASLQIKIMPSMSRGGAFCGRGSCDPTDGFKKTAHISATLKAGESALAEFTCYESTDETLD